MLDTVPAKSDYDYGANYLRIFSTFIPRIVWPDKPLFGRDQWIAAWIAGSEMKRDDDVHRPGDRHPRGDPAQRRGAGDLDRPRRASRSLLRTGYEYFRLHDGVPWVQAWWSLTYYNAWFMTVDDDPLNWFYYN